MSFTRLAGTYAAFAASILIAGGAAYAGSAEITADGVGDVELGARASQLKEAGLIGNLRPGCELGGPDTRTARLRAPLEGAVNFTQTQPRRADNILITGGASASGVGIGYFKRSIKKVFPNVKIDHDTEETFGITLAKVPKSDGGKFQFAIDVATRKIISIGVPFIAFCE